MGAIYLHDVIAMVFVNPVQYDSRGDHEPSTDRSIRQFRFVSKPDYCELVVENEMHLGRFNAVKVVAELFKRSQKIIHYLSRTFCCSMP